MNISISKELKTNARNLCLGCVSASVKVQKNNEELWEVIDKHIQHLTASVRLESLGSMPQISAMRDAYKSLGKDPSRYRGSAEALLRRILSGKGMYKINTVVDINNLVSLKTFHPVGSYDVSRVKEPLVFRAGLTGESYKGIGKEMINVENLPVFADAEGPYGSPTSDSERAMIRMETSQAMLVIISFTGRTQMEEHMEQAADLLARYSGASNLSCTIV